MQTRRVPKGQRCDGSEALALMEEFAALRIILLNVLFKEANGERLVHVSLRSPNCETALSLRANQLL